MESNKLFGLITYDKLAMVLLFTVLFLMIFRSIKVNREKFQSIERDDLGQMLEDIDSLDFNQLQKFEKELKNKENKDRETDPFKDIKGANDGTQDFLPVDLDKSFDDLIDEEEDIEDENSFKYDVINSETVTDEDSDLEMQLRKGILKNNESKQFRVGQLLKQKDISKIKNVIEDEQDLSVVGKTEKILAEDEAYKMIGNRRLLDQEDSSFLNKLVSVRNGIDKIQSGIRKAKASEDVKKTFAKLNETDLVKKSNKSGIFKGPNIDKLIDNSGKIFNKKLVIDSEEPDAINDESEQYEKIDEEVSIPEIISPTNERKQKLNLVEEEQPESIFDETRYKSISKIKSSNTLSDVKYLDADNEEDLIISNTVTNEIETETEITDDDSESKYDSDFKNPVNTIPINDAYHDKRLVEDKEEQCRDGSCKVSKKPQKKLFQIDEEGMRNRLKSNVKSGTFIAPVYQDNINYEQAKEESKLLGGQYKKLNDLRKTNKIDYPVPLSKIYNDNIPKPGILKNPTGHSNLIQSGLDLNKSSSNYYTINPSKTNHVERKISGIEETSTSYSNI